MDDDGSLDELEENCAEQNPSLTAIRQLAIQTADRATGYPKLIKLRPYSTLPDFVEACNESGQPLPQVVILLHTGHAMQKFWRTQLPEQTNGLTASSDLKPAVTYPLAAVRPI